MIENFLVQPYDVRMLVIRADVGIDDDQTISAIEKSLRRKLTDHESSKLRAAQGEQAITFTFEDAVGIRFIDPDPENPSLVAVHEAFHATVSILRFARVKFAAASEEAYAYLLTWIFKRLMEASHD